MNLETPMLGGDMLNSTDLSRMLNELMLSMDPNMTSQITALSPEEKVRFLERLAEDGDPDSVALSQDEVMMRYLEYRINKAISYYVPPLLLTMGTLGNLFSFLILRNKTMTRQSTNLFLAALAVADSIVLLVGLLTRWISDIGSINIHNESDWLCRTVSVLGYSSSQFSVWLIIAVTVERYIVVSHPLQASRFCNLSRAKRVIALLAVVSILVNIHLGWTMNLTGTPGHGSVVRVSCEPKKEFEFLVRQVWPWIDATLYAIGPLIFIVVFNTLIIVQTVRATSWRDKAQQRPFINVENQKRKLSQDNNVKITVMLLSVSFTFFITTFPLAVLMVYHDRWNKERNDISLHLLAQRHLIRTIADMLMFLNHSVNFYLYCALGQKFRNQVIRAVCGRSLSNTSNMSDHSQHLYCSRGCKINGYHLHKSTDETAL